MSELTPCNYCTYNRIKRQEELRGNTVLLRSKDGGTDLIIIEDGKERWACWFMELGNSCCC